MSNFSLIPTLSLAILFVVFMFACPVSGNDEEVEACVGKWCSRLYESTDGESGTFCADRWGSCPSEKYDYFEHISGKKNCGRRCNKRTPSAGRCNHFDGLMKGNGGVFRYECK
mmetsp:Transcript_25676/g.28562  ORF Transcript_25676/g.28562 Transcript_25676/m.28562 type:complete len:113 (+) Transcript_25676:42-380(+)